MCVGRVSANTVREAIGNSNLKELQVVSVQIQSGRPSVRRSCQCKYSQGGLRCVGRVSANTVREAIGNSNLKELQVVLVQIQSGRPSVRRSSQCKYSQGGHLQQQPERAAGRVSANTLREAGRVSGQLGEELLRPSRAVNHNEWLPLYQATQAGRRRLGQATAPCKIKTNGFGYS
jgi:hypothetical protein